jgi:hypothetical protein
VVHPAHSDENATRRIFHKGNLLRVEEAEGPFGLCGAKMPGEAVQKALLIVMTLDLIVCGAALIFLMPLGFRPGLGIGALLLMLVVLALIKAVGRRIDQSVNEERRAVRGAKGEEFIGAMLEGLGDRFLVFHDLPSPYGNIDHLVVSKETGLFLIETKAHGGRVSVVNGGLRINQRAPEKDLIAQVVRNTIWLSEQLEAKLSTKIWIKSTFSRCFRNFCPRRAA